MRHPIIIYKKLFMRAIDVEGENRTLPGGKVLSDC